MKTASNEDPTWLPLCFVVALAVLAPFIARGHAADFQGNYLAAQQLSKTTFISGKVQCDPPYLPICQPAFPMATFGGGGRGEGALLIPNRTIIVRHDQLSHFGFISSVFGRAMVCVLARKPSRATIPIAKSN